MTKQVYTGGITVEKLKKLESARIYEASELDRSWWSSENLRFPKPEDRDRAFKEGQLVLVEPCEYFTFAKEIRDVENLRYLRPVARYLLFYIMKKLDRLTNFTQRGIRLILTSLHRCDELQDELISGEEWYRAAPVGTSAHAAGAAFDIHLRQHYVKYSNDLGWLGTWNKEVADRYAPDVFELLVSLLTELYELGICNFIIENKINETDFGPVCLHVCSSPNAFPLLTRHI